MRLLLILTCAAQYLLVMCASGSDEELLSKRSISFENADITVLIKTQNGEKIAEAFNATSNVRNPRKLRWMSLGLPRLLIRNDRSKNSALKFVSGGFYVFIETLNAEVARELAKEASQKYEANITTSQFFPMDKHIGSFECSLDVFFNEAEGFVKITGKAVIIANPVVVFFKLPRPMHQYVQILRNDTNPLVFQCTIESRARNRKQNNSRLNTSADTNEISGVSFKERISLTTEDFRVADSRNESAEETRVRMDCAFAMSTRDDYMRTMLLGANLSACSAYSIPNRHSFALFTTTGTFTVPPGVRSVRVLAVGGGAGGGSCSRGGGGSGYVNFVPDLTLTPLAQIRVTVGRGGRGSTMKMNDPSQNGGAGGRSSFLSFSAAGGNAITFNFTGGDGGSGGGAPWHIGSSGTSGAGGSDGGNGANSASGRSGGKGQGAYSMRLGMYKQNAFTAGSGGAGATGSYMGGGGGGGVLMNGEGPRGGMDQLGRTFGGNGYGAGGAGGSWVNDTSKGSPCYAGGDGADGLVYIEW